MTSSRAKVRLGGQVISFAFFPSRRRHPAISQSSSLVCNFLLVHGSVMSGVRNSPAVETLAAGCASQPEALQEALGGNKHIAGRPTNEY